MDSCLFEYTNCKTISALELKIGDFITNRGQVVLLSMLHYPTSIDNLKILCSYIDNETNKMCEIVYLSTNEVIINNKK